MHHGGVALNGEHPKIDDFKVGYNVFGNNDLDDPVDDMVWHETFASTSVVSVYDDAGNLVDDKSFRYVYDP